MSKNKKIVIGVSIVVLLGVGYYFYKRNKPSKNTTPKVNKKESQIVKDAYDNVLFQTGNYTLSGSSHPSLDELAKVINNRPLWKIEVVGHTDSRGDASLNMALSKKRAEEVMKYLISKNVAPSRLKAKGMGENQPIADNDTEDGREKNRRVEFVIIK